jgi:hypothetical protein
VSIATPTAASTTTQASLPSRAAVRWYQLAVLVLALALAAVTALAVYLAVHNPTVATVPATSSGTNHSGTVAEQPCWQPQIPC